MSFTLTSPTDTPTETAFVDVAVPVPLRRTFTYKVPEALAARLAPGSRVAVPFSGRKLPGFVLGSAEAPPPTVKRVMSVAGLIDPDPVFPPELLSFLQEAAKYYVHPIGEVLKAAAPAMPTGALRNLREGGFLGNREALPGARLATRTALFARVVLRGEDAETPRLGKAQKKLLALLEERGEAGLDELRAQVKDPRRVLRSLEEKGLVETEEREVIADPFFGRPIERDEPPPLRPEQEVAAAAIFEELAVALDRSAERGPQSVLLQGVTGSGKTEVYLRVIQRALEAGRGAILLVPEIALTPQLVGRFRARLGDEIAVLHSGLGDRERQDHWSALRKGVVRLAIGARSALFAPVQDLAVIVVDEEHDSSFKQEEGFRYHGRDLALLRANRARAVCILGSATPALESRAGAESGRLRRLVMTKRATQQRMPEVELVDLTRHREGPTKDPLLSAPLYRALGDALSRKEQAILFLNRRGFSSSMRCDECGALAHCPACSVPLTEHRRAGLLRCHYCDFATSRDTPCAECKSPEIVSLGIGTEQLEDTLQRAFPEATVARLDRDTASGAGVERVLTRLRRREVDILVGTQMVTKGHDLPWVTVVGVVLADQSLGFPDFRSGERTFQLLSQVAGRAGRGERPGRVFFQTFQPEHPAIRFAAQHDYEGFFQRELENRRELGYSPYSRLVAVRVDAGDDRKARRATEILAEVARRTEAVAGGAVQLLGPAPAPIEKLRGRFRHRFLLRSRHRAALRAVARALVARIDEGVAPARASVDIDPVSML